jgi:hypothetical protein
MTVSYSPVAATLPMVYSAISGNLKQFCVALTNTCILNDNPWFIAVSDSAPNLVLVASLLNVTGSRTVNIMGPASAAKASGAQFWD